MIKVARKVKGADVTALNMEVEYLRSFQTLY